MIKLVLIVTPFLLVAEYPLNPFVVRRGPGNVFSPKVRFKPTSHLLDPFVVRRRGDAVLLVAVFVPTIFSIFFDDFKTSRVVVARK